MSYGPMSSAYKVSVVLGNYPHTLAIKSHGIDKPPVKLHFNESYKPLNKAFDDMVQKQAFDVSEMAVATFLQALDGGKPLRLMPVVMLGEFHHGSLIHTSADKTITPADLKGQRVGVRAYTQTTGLWVRGILQEQYGVASDDVTWVTTQAPHVENYVNPPNVELVETGNLLDMLAAGDITAAIMGSKQTKGLAVRQVIPDVNTAIRQWYAIHRAVPANHMVVVTDALLESHFDAAQYVYEMLKQGIDETRPSSSDEPWPNQAGVDKVWPVVQLANQYAFEQKLVSRIFDKDDIFGEMRAFN